MYEVGDLVIRHEGAGGSAGMIGRVEKVHGPDITVTVLHNPYPNGWFTQVDALCIWGCEYIELFEIERKKPDWRI